MRNRARSSRTRRPSSSTLILPLSPSQARALRQRSAKPPSPRTYAFLGGRFLAGAFFVVVVGDFLAARAFLAAGAFFAGPSAGACFAAGGARRGPPAENPVISMSEFRLRLPQRFRLLV